MIDRLVIFPSCLMISIIIAFLSIDYPLQYNLLLGIITLAGALMAFYEFFRSRK